MISSSKYLLLAAGLMFFSAKSFADPERCNGLNLNMAPGSYNLNANSFPTLNVNVQRNNTVHGCSYFVTVDYGSASSANARQLISGGNGYPVQIYKDSGKSQILKQLNDANSSADLITNAFPDSSGSSSQNTPYFVFLNPALYNRFGTYTQSFTFRLYSGTLSDYRLEDSATLNLQYTQGRNIDLSLVDTGEEFDRLDTTQMMNFGNLVAGASQGFDLILNYNAGFRLTVSSANNGKLKHQSLSDTITYNMTIAGQSAPLSLGPVIAPSISGTSPTGGLRLPVAVTIGSVSGKNSGTYKDTVTFSVVSVE